MNETKYLIYKVSGGLNHMLNQINNAIHLSKTLNRFLIIDCYSGAFKNDFNKYFQIPNFKYSTSYNCLYENKNLDKNFESYISSKLTYNNGIYFLKDKKISYTYKEILNNFDNIIYFTYLWSATYTEWYIKVKESVINEILSNKIDNQKYIGVHFRNTPDKQNNLNKFIRCINKLNSNCNAIYLSTDDYNAYESFSTKLNKYKILQLTKPIKIDPEMSNIHYSNPNKDEIIMNTLIDMYHLTYSTYFIPSMNSSLSKRVIKLREEDNFFK